jgi:hypothetical protein
MTLTLHDLTRTRSGVALAQNMQPGTCLIGVEGLIPKELRGVGADKGCTQLLWPS